MPTPTVPNFTRHCRSARLNLSDLVSSLGVEKGGRIEGRFTPLLPSQEVHVFRGFTCPMTLHYPWRVLKSLKKTNAMFIMVYSLQELEKPWIRSNMLHDLHAMYVLLKMLKAPDHRDRAQENSDLWDVETGGKERLAASHSHIEPCKDVLWSCQNRSIAKERWVSGKMAPSLRV